MFEKKLLEMKVSKNQTNISKNRQLYNKTKYE